MPQIYAHRGASSEARENTIAAFEAAAAVDADWVELDVRRTADDVLVVHHDAHLEDGRAIIELASDELPDYVPTLLDALDSCPDMGVNIEVKNSPGDPDYDDDHQISVAVAGLAAAYRTPDNVLISSFNIEAIARIQAIDASLPVSLLVFDMMDPVQLIERSAARGHSAVNPYLAIVDRRLVELAHDAGLEVNVWTINDAETIERMLGLGVDGIITDEAALARQIVEAASA